MRRINPPRRAGLGFAFLMGVAALLVPTSPTAGASPSSPADTAWRGSVTLAATGDRAQANCHPQVDFLVNQKVVEHPETGDPHLLATEVRDGSTEPGAPVGLNHFTRDDHQLLDACVDPQESRALYLKPRHSPERKMCYGVPRRNNVERGTLALVPCESTRDGVTFGLFDKRDDDNSVVLKVVHRDRSGNVSFKCVVPSGGRVEPTREIVQVSCDSVDTSKAENRWAFVGLPKNTD
ncbi:hypothetical protein LX15_002297 [Streptoalloteichus tenebrarius]|uniref:Uncharacterized protein n=1 Tax=Streptoalloteichus tenebrarius (strain ATCC 17920 / DSM 40477 / JCM 4838 / CBS 697.72 / NBRC 16177 / NCIMB 11028 / NRRL B-12390 / A12253. 1 / ISP 5477) TaxID=1933 RepID=A0ABT1HST6_STRSD|nr:hypothetical protein [Streptoalloteichus tenebrarius]MCP2258599.1 hypothetical protein [Streptoalloteichus tenebrarius]BFF04028.1 hypothetical protein GCM10020241_57030 [Streptoalloteichus tenebrarius]